MSARGVARVRIGQIGLVLLAVTLPVAAQEGDEEREVRVEVRVTSVVGDGLYLDAGRERGLEPGDRVVLVPSGSKPVEARVVTVSRLHARAQLVNLSTKVAVGTPGEVRIPAARLEGRDAGDAQVPARAPPEPTAEGPLVPAPAAEQDLPAGQDEPPVWSAPPEEWNSDLPLLAPARAISAEERDVELRGSTYVSVDATRDEGADTTLARAGLDAEVTNLFGQGGRLQLDLEAFARTAHLDDAPDEDDSRARLDRFSYRWGGLRGEASGWEVGRFLQSAMPELGVLDGAEWSWRTGSGDLVSASVGFLPEPTPDMETGEDLQVAAGWRHLVGAEDELALGLALQKTWHDGTADRDLILGSIDWTPGPDLFLHGTAAVDLYGSDEAVKESGAELTEAHLSLVRRVSERGGFNLLATHLTWPDLARMEYRDVSPSELEDFEVTRLGLGGWRELGEVTRLSARADAWRDAEDDGFSGELQVAWRSRGADWRELALALFGSDGKYSSVLGLRASARGRAGAGFWTLGVESGLHEQDDFFGEQGELLQHVVRGSWDVGLGARWDLSLWGDQRLGDEQEATSAGLSLRRRF